MKKILVCILCLLMLAGCGASKNESDKKDRDNDKNESHTEQIANKTEAEGLEEITELPEEDFVPPEGICNTWYCHTINADGDDYVIILVLNEDGTAEYKTGYPNSELIELYFGEWTLQRETLSLKVKGGMNDIDDGIETAHGLEGTYNWLFENNMLILSDLSGDGLLYNHMTGTYTFTPFI